MFLDFNDFIVGINIAQFFQVWTELLAEGWTESCLEALEKVQVPGEEIVLPIVTGLAM